MVSCHKGALNVCFHGLMFCLGENVELDVGKEGTGLKVYSTIKDTVRGHGQGVMLAVHRGDVVMVGVVAQTHLGQGQKAGS